MRYRFLIFFFVAIAFSLQGQDNNIPEKGVVSYIASQNIYVKFKSTENIKIGDTLFIKKENVLKPILVVINKSSISCICSSLNSQRINVSDVVITQKTVLKGPVKLVEEKTLAQKEDQSDSLANQPRFHLEKSSYRVNTNKIQQPINKPITFSDSQNKKEFEQNIKGRISVASYNNISDERTLHRMRYAFSLRANNLGNSRF